MSQTHEAALKVLKQYFGFDSFRPHQGFLIEQLLAGRDVLGVMPTGAGKSLIYQIPALLAEGTTIIISPLISLMKDQVDALRQAGVEAAFLNSSITVKAQNEILARVSNGTCKLLYVAPERLEDQRLLALCQKVPIPFVAVDEAHCISQWGNDFRPSYRRIAAFITSLPERPCVSAMTATATHQVREDIVSLLGMRRPVISVAGFDRKNLYLGVERPDPSKKQAKLLSLIKSRRGQNGIVYCSTRAAVEEVCELLLDEGLSATMYHAGLTDKERKHNQEDFLYDKKMIMVATNAFGMGIDKSNVSFVFHFNMPRDVESYYQEAGRAGRDGSPADCILIYNKKDVLTANYFAEKASEERLASGMDRRLSDDLYDRDLDRVRKMTAYCTTTDCLRSYILRYFGESDTPYRCEHCSSCGAENEMVDATVEAQKIISCVLRLEQRERAFGRVMIVDILRGSQAQAIMRQRLDTLSTYGIMKEVPGTFVHAVLDALVEDGSLFVSEGKYPVVSCTAKGRALLKSEEPFMIRVAKTKTRADIGIEGQVGAGRSKKPGGRKGRISVGVVGDAGEVDPELLARLKALRTRLAQEQNLPAYIVFPDSALLDMCHRMPRTVEEFLLVSGVGQRKAELYAQDFLACLNKQDA